MSNLAFNERTQFLTEPAQGSTAHSKLFSPFLCHDQVLYKVFPVSACPAQSHPKTLLSSIMSCPSILWNLALKSNISLLTMPILRR